MVITKVGYSPCFDIAWAVPARSDKKNGASGGLLMLTYEKL